jgi:hypothetical protein
MQDRRDEIVKAAERLQEFIDEGDYLGVDVFADSAPGSGANELYRELSAALALPETAWTKEPPSVAGWYWWRAWVPAQTYPNGGHAVTTEAGWLVECEHLSERALDPARREAWPPVEWKDREWWPVAVTPPMSESEPGPLSGERS